MDDQNQTHNTELGNLGACHHIHEKGTLRLMVQQFHEVSWEQGERKMSERGEKTKYKGVTINCLPSKVT